MNDLVNPVIEANTITRSASDVKIARPVDVALMSVYTIDAGETIPRVGGRQLEINFARNAVAQNNTVGASDGVMKYNWNDGETTQNEAGGPFPRDDAATVTAAASTTIADDSRCTGACTWVFYPNYSMVVVASGAGAGAGQWRHITAQTGNPFTVDKPFDVIPAPGDHFTISYPGFENALIRGNKMSNNPKGIDLYHGAMMNVSVVGNTLMNNGGIDFNGTQRNLVDKDPAKITNFSVARNIEMKGNTITNTTGVSPIYIFVVFQQCWLATFWGKSGIGIEVRNNKVTAPAGTYPFPYPEAINLISAYQSPVRTPWVEEGKGAFFGTVF
jgi:hypothetical protein